MEQAVGRLQEQQGRAAARQRALDQSKEQLAAALKVAEQLQSQLQDRTHR